MSSGQQARKMSDMPGTVRGEYIKPQAVYDAKATFIITGARVVKGGKFGDKIEFDVRFVSGLEPGSSATMSMPDSPRRVAMAEDIRAHGAVGPLKLVQVDTDKGNAAWVFRDADDSGPLPDADGEEDLPF